MKDHLEDITKLRSLLATTIVVFSLLHIITISLCGFMLIDILVTSKQNDDFSMLHSPEDFGRSGERESRQTIINTINHETGTLSRMKRQQVVADKSTCGETVYIAQNSQISYLLQTPNYPNNYSNNLRCEWNFILEFPKPSAYVGSASLDEKVLRLTFLEPIAVEYHRNCSYDAIQVRGGSSTGPIIAEGLCGFNTTQDVIAFNGLLYISFRSDQSITAKGFQAEISVIPRGLLRPEPGKAMASVNFDILSTAPEAGGSTSNLSESRSTRVRRANTEQSVLQNQIFPINMIPRNPNYRKSRFRSTAQLDSIQSVPGMNYQTIYNSTTSSQRAPSERVGRSGIDSIQRGDYSSSYYTDQQRAPRPPDVVRPPGQAKLAEVPRNRGTAGVPAEPGAQGQPSAPGEPGSQGDYSNSRFSNQWGAPSSSGRVGGDGQPSVPGQRGEMAAPQRSVAQGQPGSNGDLGDSYYGDRIGADGQPGQQEAPGGNGAQWQPSTPGQAGEPGQQGAPGQTGVPGQQGAPGQQGLPGQEGAPGQPGAPRQPGSQGAYPNSYYYRGRSGANGQPGQQGSPGQRGQPGSPGQAGAAGERGRDGDAGFPGPPSQSFIRGQTGAPGRDGAPGQQGAPGTPGRDGANGQPGQIGRPGSGNTGSPGRDGHPGPPSQSFIRADVTYIHYGRFGCTYGRKFYDGYLVGFANGGSQSLKCSPLPNEIQRTGRTLPSGPSLVAARFNLEGINVPELTQTYHNKVIKCVLCHETRSAIITVIGWNSCNAGREWLTVYSGYLMAADSASGTSEPICMDKRPEVEPGYGTDPKAPELKLVKSGRGLWIEEKAIPCAVCIKTADS